MPKASLKKTSSVDYPSLAKKLLEASGDGAASKLPAGLYIVATPIGHRGDMTMRGLVTLSAADLVACEDTRVTGALLSAYGIVKKRLISYHDHNAEGREPELLQHIKNGKAVALVSDAGMPLIADPGFPLVRACREDGYPVVVIPGANAALTALAGSGLPTAPFYFAGFLPPRSAARKTALADLKTIPATLVFYETPQRIGESLRDMADILGGNRTSVVARELTKLFEETKRGTLQELASFYATHLAKGEMVVLIGPAAKIEAKDAIDLDGLLRDLLRTLTLRDAVATACDATGLKKSEVYTRALWLAGKSGK